VARATPLQRKLLVCSTRGEGREMLRALARAEGRWVGFDVTTVRPLALEVAGPRLSSAGLVLLDEFQEQALVDELLDEALADTPEATDLATVSEGVGFRRAVRDAVSALRLAGVTPERVARAAWSSPSKRALIGRILRRHRERLRAERWVDTAAVLAAAIAAAEAGASLGAEVVLLVPGLGTRGLAGRFLATLQRRGARLLTADPVAGRAPSSVLWGEPSDAPAERPSAEGSIEAGGAGVPPGSLGFFRAAGVTEELREVLRRVLTAGVSWDEVEIVTPDPGVYGPALHGLAERLDIPVTFAVGLPVERTRPGRVIAAWMRWVQEGFPDSVLRSLLEADDLRAPHPWGDVGGARLARTLRGLRIGWGRERYLPALEQRLERLRAEGPRPRKDEGLEEAEKRHRGVLRELEALGALLGPLVASAPPVPGRLDPVQIQVSPAGLAAGLSAMLAAVTSGGTVDDTALERLGLILDRVRATLTRPTTFAAALAVLAEHLAIRVPAPRAEGRAPWGSAGGHLHLSDVEHGGLTGRRATFLVGLDSGRFPGAGGQDAILLDGERLSLAAGDLPTSADRLHERRFRMGALLARLRGPLTLSWAAWDASEGRVLSPSPLLLQMYRLAAADASAGFRDLERHVGDPVSRIPAGAADLDGEDVWLRELSRDGRLLSGETVVRAAYPELDRGLRARSARAGDPSAHQGIVRPRPALDPRTEPRPVLSSTRLERLGACPLRYFYQDVLRVAPPEDPRFDPERWLDPLARGSLLHEVYDRVLRTAARLEIGFGEAALQPEALLILREVAERTRREVPAPSEVVYRREMVELERELGSFLGMVEKDLPDWVETELRFGFFDSPHAAVEVELPGGSRILLRGAVDRVDRLPFGRLRVVDYKTGSPRRYNRASVYDEGRRLQHLLYSMVVERLLGAPVDRMEYHFPTRKGENERVPFLRSDLGEGPRLLDRLLDLAASGRFLPTEQQEDCLWCSFARICRVGEGRGGKPSSPLARWAGERFEEAPFDLLRAVRRFEGAP
jgi:ATP-dependent helicase/nuclease subunit B